MRSQARRPSDVLHVPWEMTISGTSRAMLLWLPLLLWAPLGALAEAPCPADSFRNEDVVWKCGQAQGTIFLLYDASRSPKVRIPAGVKNLRFTVEGPATGDFNFKLVDAGSPSVSVLGSTGFGVPATYRGMSITCAVSEESPGGKKEKTCQISETHAALELHVSLQEKETFFFIFAYSHDGLTACPPLLPGCLSYSVADSQEDIAEFAEWARCGSSKTPKDVSATFHNLTTTYHVQLAGNAKVVPWFMWEGVWEQFAGTAGRSNGNAVFKTLDTNHDEVMSQEELSAGLAVSECPGSSSESAGGGSFFLKDAWWKNFEWWESCGWIVVVVLLWALCGLLICCTQRKRRKRKLGEDADEEQNALVLPHQQYNTYPAYPQYPNSPMGSYAPPSNAVISPKSQSQMSRPGSPQGHAAIYDRLLGNPELRTKVEEHPASLRFHKARLLGYTEHMTDGFRAVFAREVLLVDGSHDPALRGFMEFLRSTLPLDEEGSGFGSVGLIAAAAKAVAAGFGGALHGHDERFQQRMHQLRLEYPRDLPIGLLLGRHDPGAGLQEPGTGLPRHRAVLFKHACDSLSICNCALLWDAKRDTALNVVWTGGHHGRPMLVDTSSAPGQLKEAYDLHHLVQQITTEREQAENEGGFSP